MSPGSHASPHHSPGGAGTTRRRAAGWRLGTPLVLLGCGALLVTSAANSGGTDLRPGRYGDLASLTAQESATYEQLQERVAELTADVERLTAQVGSSDVRRIQARVESLEGPAGLRPRSGPGLTITLSDAPAEVIDASSRDLNDLVVHQQDIQAVVNALWNGGAEAMTIQGQRIITTTGIKCEGPAVMLQGVAYAQPYVISAVGNPAALEAAVAQDDYLQGYRRAAAAPDISVGWEMTVEERIDAPAYEGLTDLQYAEPLG
ncbi:MAG TPA: DUF881 domain-containing protein [Nocardioides sp.]|nr:DUF881 domain-containing protein [Nocardioides sp.]